ncbi:MAG: hypothetical protein ACRDN0_24135 [Trebonia sp.]
MGYRSPAGVAHSDDLAALVGLAGVGADHEQDRRRALDRLPDDRQVSGPGVGLGPVVTALRLDDDDQRGGFGRPVGDDHDRVGRELRGHDRVQARRAEACLQVGGQGNVRHRPEQVDGNTGALPDQLQRRLVSDSEGWHVITVRDSSI